MSLPAFRNPPNAVKESTVIVAVRVRPENRAIRKCVVVKPSAPNDENAPDNCSATATQLVVGNKSFSYDHVFDEEDTQATVYTTLVTRLVASCFRGYNATIFAYGQTGSGKTHSVVGLPMEEEEEGLIPRAIRNVFSFLEDRKNDARIESNPSASSSSTSLNLLSVHVSFLEIYNDECRDLLHPDIPSREIMIREDKDGRVFFTGAREEVRVWAWHSLLYDCVCLFVRVFFASSLLYCQLFLTTRASHPDTNHPSFLNHSLYSLFYRLVEFSNLLRRWWTTLKLQ